MKTIILGACRTLSDPRRSYSVFEIDEDYLDEYRKPRTREQMRAKVGYYGVWDQDHVTEADGFDSRAQALDYIDCLLLEEAGR